MRISFDNGASAQAQAARMGSPCPIHSPDCLRGRRWWHRELLHPTRLQCDRCRCVSLSLSRAVIACCPLTFRDRGLCFAAIAESPATDSVPLGVVPSIGLSLHEEPPGVCCSVVCYLLSHATLVASPPTPICMVHLSSRCTGGGH